MSCDILKKAIIECKINDNEMILGKEQYELYFILCKTYFIDTLWRTADYNFIKNELHIVQNNEIKQA